MAGVPDYGTRLTDDEYERRVVELHRGMPPMPTPEEDRALRRRALDLAIDHRLGRDFPQTRREALWAASERVDSRRIWLSVRYMLGTLLWPVRRSHAEALTKALTGEYSKVLSQPELSQFLGLKEGQRPALPVDPPAHAGSALARFVRRTRRRGR
jgi:hypothetical protein